MNNYIHGNLEDRWKNTFVDSSRSRQVELDRLLAEMLQEIEDKKLKKDEKKGEKKEEKEGEKEKD